MSRPVIITCALTGGMDNAHQSPHLPATPEEIAREALAARAAGAAIVHIHVRDPVTRKPSRELALYREVVARIRDAGSDVLVNLTTGAGARFVPDERDPRNGGPGTTMATPESRVEHILELRPDICSLDVATMNFGRHAFLNVPDHLDRMAALVREAGAKPEIEVFDLGHARLAAKMASDGAFAPPVLFQLCLGIPWGAPASTEDMLSLLRLVPPGAVWSAFGISRHQLPMAAQAVILGGHVRVGLEDNLYLSKGVLSPGNAPLVERAVAIIESLGERVATPGEAREILRISR